MKRIFSLLVVLLLALSLAMVSSLFAQIRVDPASKLDRLEATVQTIDKKAMTMVVREIGTSNLDYTIVYNDKTTFTYRNEKAALDDVKNGVRIVVLGKADGATKLVAQRIDIRQK